MTEAEWLTAVNAQKMIAPVSTKGSERLWRLFAVACARRIEHLMRYENSRRALDVAEQYADGLATSHDLDLARTRAEAAARQAHFDEYEDEVRANFCMDAEYEAVCAAMRAADTAVQCVAQNISPAADGRWAQIDGSVLLPDLLRDVFGNPFRIPFVDPAWLEWNDGTVPRLAQVIYDERAFDRMPALADALEDAGCDDADILRHCREPGEHVRGCWVIDLLLGKE
jgi:hypothetical protein